MSKFSKTKVLVEVEVETQFGPQNAVNLIKTSLKCPAVSNIVIKDVKSNYVLHGEPLIEYKTVENLK